MTDKPATPCSPVLVRLFVLTWIAFLAWDVVFLGMRRNTATVTQREILKPPYTPNGSATAPAAPILQRDSPGALQTVVFDEHGFLNLPGSWQAPHDAVVWGCSFGNHGGNHASFAAQLARGLNQRPVYNISVDGKGACASLAIYHGFPPLAEHWREHSPQFVVWLIYEAGLFPGYFRDFLSVPGRDANAGTALSERWHWLLADLRKNSGTARVANWLFLNAVGPVTTRINTQFVGRRLNETILQEALETAEFGPILIPENDISLARMERGLRDLPLVTDVIAREARCLARAGTKLVVALIPDKRAAYPRLWRGDMRIEALLPPGEDLRILERLLTERGVECVNLLPLYQQMSQPGAPFLYYWNDHHWNVAAIGAAAEAVATRMKALGFR